ncbi:MAG TPA: beta-ketoacyl synthase N-terminal-like domain-containing protein, partial [Actinocrinis sp.]|nr:beta-ketoacyl synthase N-terminal-like domain-containing protein [Actinocrinis sp.]
MLRATTPPRAEGGLEDVVLAAREDVAMRLFLFLHAGGQHTSFQDWPDGLPDDVELVSYALPDRGRRHGGAPYLERRHLVSDLVDLVARHDDGVPFAFFGHSFGALVAFEVCHRLSAAGRRTPGALLVSARRAPHVSAPEAAHALPDGEFLDLVRLWGLIPEELLADGELLRLVLPPLRSDLALDEEHRHESDARVSVPCVVYGGAEDRTVGRADLERWGECVADGVGFDVEMLPGGHFFTLTSRPELLNSVAGHLDRVRAQARPSVCSAEGRWYPAPELGVWERFRRQAAAEPGAPALLDPARQWSYREVDDAATALAAELLARGAGKGAPVGLLLPHSAEYCISLLSCFAIGAPACLLEKNWPASLLARFVESAGVGIVVTTPELAGLLPPDLRAGARTLVLGELWWDTVAQGHDAPDFPEVAPSDIALISMTSGTSGVPKAVVNSHLGCLYCFDARYELYPYEESSRDGLNVFFAWECLRPLLAGRSAAVIPDDHIFDPVRLVDTLREQAVTRIVIPPSLLESVLDHPAVGPQVARRLDHMEVIFLMGEVVPSRVVDKAAALLPAHVRLVNAYSTWESLDVSFADLLPRPAAGPAPSAFAPVGRILDGSAAVLLDAHGRVVPYGGVGELYFAGPGVAAGYLDDPVKTAERFAPAPAVLADSPFADQVFYRTGDRARFLDDGGLEILGRTGDVVKVRGFKVSLRSVEAVLSGHPGVSRVIVRPVLDGRTKQPNGLVAYVVGEGGHPSDTALARLRQTAKRDLPEYARPRSFVGLDTVPISQSGSRKLDLSALPAPPDEPGAGSREEALTAMERRLAAAWRDVLGGRSVGAGDNFFDAGGDSLSAARLSGLLAQRFGISVSVVEIFQAATLRDMAVQLSGGSSQRDPAAVPRARPTGRVKLAVVGMAGRFPGAPDLGAFWENLRQGTDSLTEFSADQLRDRGVPEEVLTHPKWVPAAQLLADADKFDAQFWGVGRREAVLTDPQQRVFLEVAWSALEQAGYARRSNPHRRRTGVFASCGIDGYLIHHLRGGGLMEPLDPAAVFLTEIGNEKDYLATRVAYMLDLGGPAMTVTSACSSALVAISQAAQALMSGQCDMAIAGASSINFPNLGYRYEDGLVGSADGRVRPFDQEASGTLFGDSAGAVVLKRLDDALADGDHVWAVVSGFGVSNDGHMKAGYAAPSARAQSQCISDAIAMAGIDSGQISYVECHATATHIGDAIELKGLSDAFAEHRAAAEPLAGSCAIGSVKGNIGHANCAAGITGFIKTVLCLYHRTLVPTANYRVLNPKLVDFVDADGSPFTIEQSCREWSVAAPEHQLPRRAGVSSFGIGGTNAHVILEEPPVRAPAPGDAIPNGPEAERRSLHLVTASARTAAAFSRNADALAGFLEALPDDDVAAAVRSIHLTRESHALRGYAVVRHDRDREQGFGDLRRLSEQPPRSALRRGTTAVAFCFPGQGSQTAGMARGLYRGGADGGRFRSHFDTACRSLARHLGTDPAAAILGADADSVMRPLITQCGLFAVEYALAMTFIDIGVKPVASAGHSVG